MIDRLEKLTGETKDRSIGQITSFTVKELLEKFPDKRTQDIEIIIKRIRKYPPIEDLATLKDKGEVLVKIKYLGPDAYAPNENFMFSEFDSKYKEILQNAERAYNESYPYAQRGFDYKQKD